MPYLLRASLQYPLEATEVLEPAVEFILHGGVGFFGGTRSHIDCTFQVTDVADMLQDFGRECI